ncbi:hypothetical protein FRB99_000078 [Tulasnella sp. 403]|nr:hypothetical protein FRB99_000078 [Tulasnella sp. 403]
MPTLFPKNVKKGDRGREAFMDSMQAAMQQRSAQLNYATGPDGLPANLNHERPMKLEDAKSRYKPWVTEGYEMKFVLKDEVGYKKLMDAVAATLGAPSVTVVNVSVWKERGSKLWKEGKWKDARWAFWEAMRAGLGLGEGEPAPSRSACIKGITVVEWEAFCDLVACANNIAQSYVQEGNQGLALDWLDEVHCMYDSYGMKKLIDSGMPAYPWKDFNINCEEFVSLRLKAHVRQSIIYKSLGNTAAAYSAAMQGLQWGTSIIPTSSESQFPAIEELRSKCVSDARVLGSKRHPAPVDVASIQVTEPELQVRGVWKKLRVGGGAAPVSRLGHSSVVWKGKYYVFGGEHGSGKTHSDGWVLDLRQTEAGWRRVPGPPGVRYLTYCPLAQHQGKAYLFLGREIMPVFDLVTEKWSQVSTKFGDGTRWKDVFPRDELGSHAVGVYKDTLYVFGGRDPDTLLGRNILMALNLKTFKWRMVSGTVRLHPDISLPCVREHPASWIIGQKMYVAFGDASRSSAILSPNGEQGASTDFSYQDLWSYDMEEGVWTKERALGNVPCPRTELGCMFNSVWNRVVFFGGYSSSLVFVEPLATSGFGFNYFGDTFVWSPENGKFAQVITRGFPTYRALGNMFTDEGTGRTYMFGGCKS